MKLICVIVFAYADCWFSHAAAQFKVRFHHFFASSHFGTEPSPFGYLILFLHVLKCSALGHNKETDGSEPRTSCFRAKYSTTKQPESPVASRGNRENKKINTLDLLGIHLHMVHQIVLTVLSNELYTIT